MSPLKNILACPVCHQSFVYHQNLITCPQCHTSYLHSSHIILENSDQITKSDFTYQKWESYYQHDESKYSRITLTTNRKIAADLGLTKNSHLHQTFLEIGCGTFNLGQLLAPYFETIIGVDFSPTALMIADRLLRAKKITNYLLIQADVRHIPVKNESVDYYYGGGVIEHFDDVDLAITESYRLLRKNGVATNHVPIVNIGSLTYRQIWGNIPEVPVLKNILKFIHFKILSPKRLYFGYERSYRRGQLKKWHLAAGFKQVVFDGLKLHFQFGFIPRSLRPFCRRLALKNWLFWPMATVTATK
jgi:ubiquinone/menaquinone biosynthesis C-methylase UbiE